jgi:hypothetical protein
VEDYDINREVVLACQQSGGSSQMASTFGSLLPISHRSIWMNCFTLVEEKIGSAQILLGERIMKHNLQGTITISPMDTNLNKAMATLMMSSG